MNEKNNKLKKITNTLRCCKAEFYIETLIGILLFTMVLVIGMAVVPVIINKIRIDYAADEIARYVALSGNCDVSESSIQKIIDTYDISYDEIEIKPDTPEAYNETRIQLSDGFSVRVNHPMTISFGGFAYSFNINITSIARGRSEVYWKDLDEP